jgi:hypothetical protein
MKKIRLRLRNERTRTIHVGHADVPALIRGDVADGLTRSLAIPLLFVSFECNDAGVPMMTADSDATLAEAMASVTGVRDQRLVDVMSRSKARTGRAPVFTVRVTHLGDGSTVLGVCWHHSLGDMATFMGLARAWSAALDGGRASRLLSIAVDTRRRLGLDPSLVGNLVNTINLPCQRDDGPARIAAKLRHAIEHYATEHNNYHASLRPVAALRSPLDLYRCVPLGIDPLRETVMMTSWAKFGVYDVKLGGAAPVYFTPAAVMPVPWLASLVEGFEGRGLLVGMGLPNAVADRFASPDSRARLHAYRRNGDKMPALSSALPELI